MQTDKKESKGDWQITTVEGMACQRTERLWSEVFSEDSEQFTNYYYEHKVNDNIGYLIEQSENLCAMLFLSPYPVIIQKELHSLHYIVGVATKAIYRHQGMMKRMLEQALRDMSNKGEPFTFLMPASPAIYEPFQFTYVYQKRELTLNRTLLKDTVLFRISANKEVHLLDARLGTFELSALQAEEVPELVQFANRWLEQNQDVYVKRSEAYYHLARKEIMVQGGNLILIRKEKKLVGFFLFAHESTDVINIQEAMILPEFEALPLLLEKERKPMIMARILDVKKMLSYARCKEDLHLLIKVTDPIISANNGVFECFFSKKSSKIVERTSELEVDKNSETMEHTENFVACTIEGLTAFLFGYDCAENCFSFHSRSQQETYCSRLQQLSCIEHVFLNEIV